MWLLRLILEDQQQYQRQMSHLKEPKGEKQQLVFFKNFISIDGSYYAGHSNLMLQRRIQRPQRSHLALKKALNEIDSKQAKSDENEEGCQLRRSATSQAKRKKSEQPLIHNQFNVLLRTIHRKAQDSKRSKTVGKCRTSEQDNKYAKIGEINKLFKERREKETKVKADHCFHRSIAQERSHNPTMTLKADNKLSSNPKPKTITLPLQSKYKSSGHLAPLSSNLPFEVTESSDILLSNLLNPEPESRQLRKESSDSAKRFYMKLKKRKEGSLWKPLEKELTLLDSESVSKEIPSQLGICKIKLPKRNYRHEFLQNIQKIKQNYLRIRGNAQYVKEKIKISPAKTFQKSGANDRGREKRMYEIKYKGKCESSSKQLARSKTQFFENRSQWEVFVNTPLQPWQTEENYKLL